MNIRLGLRSKLITLFVLIKVLPLIGLAYLAWHGVGLLGVSLSQTTDYLVEDVKKTVGEMSNYFVKESVKALDDRAREELERLTTDTAQAVADFLYDRDSDILAAAALFPNEQQYQAFLETRRRPVNEIGIWELTENGQRWVSHEKSKLVSSLAVSHNAENWQNFNARPPELVSRGLTTPLYYELTYVDLQGHELIKASQGDVLPKGLRDVSQKANTWSRAETYFSALKLLKPGEIYVSEVIGPHVPSRVIGIVTPKTSKEAGVSFEPEKEAFAGQENPRGRQFQGIVRWATPVVKNGVIAGYVTMALNHDHIRRFTDHITPTSQRYISVPDPNSGNYAFMWDYKDRNIAHPRHYSIMGFDPKTGEYSTPWLDETTYKHWKDSKRPLSEFLQTIRPFENQSRNRKPASELTKAGLLGLDCRYLNFAPQCQGWHELTQYGGSGSFLIQWSGVWKRTTAAAIPYFTGQYANSPRGFGYITIGANIEDFHAPAKASVDLMDQALWQFGERMKGKQQELQNTIISSVSSTAAELLGSTILMLIVVVMIAIWLASLLTRRIINLVDGLARIEAGDFSFRFELAANDELRLLNRSLNNMADSVQMALLQSEKARMQAEENSQMKSEFVANVSHELRTPLNGILGFSQIISEDAKDIETREYAQVIHQSGQHLLAVVNDMLDVAKIEAGHITLEPLHTDIRTLLNELIQLHGHNAQQKGLKLRVDMSERLPGHVYIDPKRLRQVINNLLHNAVKFTSAGEVVLSANWTGKSLVIGVRDTGPGIAAEFQEVVFERFRQASTFITRQHGGTGLGLALVRENAKLMGGTISLKSELGHGSYFEFTIPEFNQVEHAPNLVS